MDNEKKVSVKKENRLLIIGIVVAVIALGFIVVFGTNRDKEEPSPSPQPTEAAVIYGDEELGINPKVDEELKDYRNIVLFGIDTAAAADEKGHRSDGIIILSINKNNDDVKIFSIYRDTYLKISDERGLDKINHAYAYGGMDQSIKALNQNLDLNIREGMSLTWDAIAGLVDDIGGVDIEILDSEISTMNGSLPSAKRIEAPGTRTLDGQQAVVYSRIRYDSPEGDHRRNERMQTVLIAAANKAKSLEFGELVTIMDELMSQVSTNMTNDAMNDILMKVADYNIDSNICWPYDTKGWMHNEIYYGVPVTLSSNVKQLHEEMFAQEDYQPTDFVESLSHDIEEQSGYYGGK